MIVIGMLLPRLGLLLEDQKIERWCRCVADERRQEAVHLAAVMRLVIEKMIKRQRQRVFDLERVSDGAIAQHAMKIVDRQAGNKVFDSVIFVSTGHAQR